ncbi:MAG: hypothetical protein EZS28_022333 [Streblomastix strix]|uniref:Reverse transcriptase domain-containing protein n=1 Tax=Streblomastix strix TaxID=222440 RepID=A0A5J4VI09_9EUKA|nr:MAG: hypothetical protein EZS28_022333 [Streblomastix strix]
MEDVQSLIILVEQEDWACSIDIQSTYYRIKVSSEFQPYQAFSVGKSTYIHIGMPFGISIALIIFTKTLSPTIPKIRDTNEVKIISYSDDILVLHILKEYLGQQIQVSAQFKMWLCWINASKMEISLPKDKKGSLFYFLKQQTHSIYRNQWQSVKQVASMIGRVIHTTVQFQRGDLHVKQISKEMNRIVKHKGQYGRAYLTKKCPAELEAVIASEAALSGWGATLQINNLELIRIFGRRYYQRLTSNQREILAIYLALKRFETTLQAMNNKRLKIQSDNSIAFFQHIKGLDSKEPDALSRLARASYNQIKSQVLIEVLRKQHKSITLDAFAN